ncbi:MAG: AarF/UbiB family protein [Deltaproteobacteria bacterium]|nr:AarF/UbiB family protein [Deltaproteobacteria bacterium]
MIQFDLLEGLKINSYSDNAAQFTSYELRKVVNDWTLELLGKLPQLIMVDHALREFRDPLLIELIRNADVEVRDSPEANAFVKSSESKIFINAGLLKRISETYPSRSKEVFLWILSHELGHIIYARKRNTDECLTLPGAVERFCDAFATYVLTRLGYDVTGMSLTHLFFERAGSQKALLLSTHPGNWSRDLKIYQVAETTEPRFRQPVSRAEKLPPVSFEGLRFSRLQDVFLQHFVRPILAFMFSDRGDMATSLSLFLGGNLQATPFDFFVGEDWKNFDWTVVLRLGLAEEYQRFKSANSSELSEHYQTHLARLGLEDTQDLFEKFCASVFVRFVQNNLPGAFEMFKRYIRGDSFLLRFTSLAGASNRARQILDDFITKLRDEGFESLAEIVTAGFLRHQLPWFFDLPSIPDPLWFAYDENILRVCYPLVEGFFDCVVGPLYCSVLRNPIVKIDAIVEQLYQIYERFDLPRTRIDFIEIPRLEELVRYCYENNLILPMQILGKLFAQSALEKYLEQLPGNLRVFFFERVIQGVSLFECSLDISRLLSVTVPDFDSFLESLDYRYEFTPLLLERVIDVIQIEDLAKMTSDQVEKIRRIFAEDALRELLNRTSLGLPILSEKQVNWDLVKDNLNFLKKTFNLYYVLTGDSRYFYCRLAIEELVSFVDNPDPNLTFENFLVLKETVGDESFLKREIAMLVQKRFFEDALTEPVAVIIPDLIAREQEALLRLSHASLSDDAIRLAMFFSLNTFASFIALQQFIQKHRESASPLEEIHNMSVFGSPFFIVQDDVSLGRRVVSLTAKDLFLYWLLEKHQPLLKLEFLNLTPSEFLQRLNEFGLIKSNYGDLLILEYLEQNFEIVKFVDLKTLLDSMRSKFRALKLVGMYLERRMEDLTVSNETVLEEIEQLLGTPSLDRDVFLEKVALTRKLSKEDCVRIYKLMTQPISFEQHESTTKQDAFIFDFLRQTSADDKANLLGWMVDLNDAPEVFITWCRRFGLDHEEIKEGFYASRCFRHGVLESLFFGESGLLASHNLQRLQRILSEFLSTLESDKTTLPGIVRKILEIFVNHQDHLTKFRVIQSLFDQLAIDNISSVEDFIAAFLGAFGTLGVKAAQAIAQIPYIMDTYPSLASKLGEAKSRAGFSMLDTIRTLVETGEIKKVDCIDKVVGSASIKVVLLIRGSVGRTKILKVKRPAKFERTQRAFLQSLFQAINELDELKSRGLQIPAKFVDFLYELVEEERNFTIEKENERLREPFGFYVPRIYRVSDSVIEEEHIESEPVGEDSDRSVRQALQEYVLGQLTRNQPFHGDLHAGNVGRPRNSRGIKFKFTKYILYDVGNMIWPTSKLRDFVRRIILAVQGKLEAVGDIRSDLTQEELEDTHRVLTGKEIQAGEKIKKLINCYILAMMRGYEIDFQMQKIIFGLSKFLWFLGEVFPENQHLYVKLLALTTQSRLDDLVLRIPGISRLANLVILCFSKLRNRNNS